VPEHMHGQMRPNRGVAGTHGSVWLIRLSAMRVWQRCGSARSERIAVFQKTVRPSSDELACLVDRRDHDVPGRGSWDAAGKRQEEEAVMPRRSEALP
jgi:hypothetical protein